MPQAEMESNLNPQSLGKPVSSVKPGTEGAARPAPDLQSCVHDGPPVDDWRHLSKEEQAHISKTVAELLRSPTDEPEAAQKEVRFLMDLAIQDVVDWWHRYTQEHLTRYGKETVREPTGIVPDRADAKFFDYWKRKTKDATASARALRDRLRELTSSNPEVKNAILDRAVERPAALAEECGDAMCARIVAKRIEQQGRFVLAPDEEGILVRVAQNSIVPIFRKLPAAWRYQTQNTDDDLVQVCAQSLMDTPNEKFRYFSVRQTVRYFTKHTLIRIKQDQGVDESVQAESGAVTGSGEFAGTPLEGIPISQGPKPWPMSSYLLWLEMNDVLEPDDVISCWVFGNLRELGLSWVEIAGILTKGASEGMLESCLPPSVTRQEAWAACTTGTVNSGAIRQKMSRWRRHLNKHRRRAELVKLTAAQDSNAAALG
jgi:hypothetical protein